MAEEANQGAGTTNPDENLDLDLNLEDTEDVDTLKAHIEQEKTAKAQILARAKKAEAELKALKGDKTEPPATQPTTNTPSLEEIDIRILKTQGLSEERIKLLKKIAAVNGSSLIDAQNDDLYKAHVAKEEAEEKSEKARLGASKGSGSQKKEKTFTSPHLSDEDHKALWRQQNQQG